MHYTAWTAHRIGQLWIVSDAVFMCALVNQTDLSEWGPEVQMAQGTIEVHDLVGFCINESCE